MKKIKTWLIHLLGGVTVKDSQENKEKGAYLGARVALGVIKEYCESLNG